jgi:hypothetical protein
MLLQWHICSQVGKTLQNACVKPLLTEIGFTEGALNECWPMAATFGCVIAGLDRQSVLSRKMDPRQVRG